MPDEYIGSGGERFGPAGPEGFAQPAAQRPDHQRHDLEVVEDRDEGGEEDDDRKHLHDEDEAHRVKVGELPEEKLDSLVTARDDEADQVGEGAQHGLAPRSEEDEGPEGELQQEGPEDGTQANGTAIGRGEDRDAEENGHS